MKKSAIGGANALSLPTTAKQNQKTNKTIDKREANLKGSKHGVINSTLVSMTRK